MTKFIDRDAMIKCAEAAVRAEAKRNPGAPWKMQEGDTHEFATAVADARKRLRGECLAERVDQVAKASSTAAWAESIGWSVPLWARNTLAWASQPEKITALYEFDDDKNVDLDDALAALARAVN